MPEITLGDLLRQETVSNLDTQEKIEYIDLDKLVTDERNFYGLRGIDTLAENIELVGLLDPIRVRPIKSSGGCYRIVSGHRRTAALKKLVADGKEKYQSVPCIVDVGEYSKTMQEIRLIWANKDTRDMTSPERLKEAERAEALLGKLREEGVELPGKMRSHVAQLCNIPESNLARLKVIRDRLHPSLRTDWEAGTLKDSVAYRIAQEDRQVQDRLFSDHGHAARCWTAERAGQAIEDIKRPKTAPATQAPKPVFQSYSAKQAADDYLARRSADDMTFFGFIRDHGFDWFLRYAAGISRRQGIDDLKHRLGSARVGHHGIKPGDHWDALPARLDVHILGQTIGRSWTEVWDAMAVEALRRCRLAQIEEEAKRKSKTEPQPTGQLVFNGWMPGGTNPATNGEVVAVFDLGSGGKKKMLCYWRDGRFEFLNGVKIDAEVIKWMTLPPDEEDDA